MATKDLIIEEIGRCERRLWQLEDEIEKKIDSLVSTQNEKIAVEKEKKDYQEDFKKLGE